jgi:galactokinase
MDFNSGLFAKIYVNSPSKQKERYLNLLENFNRNFGSRNHSIFSVPGRTELSGNHTDHNHGRVIAASINLDSVAVASANDSSSVIIFSEGFENPFKVNLASLDKIESETGTTSSLVRGIAARLKELGYNIQGFDACITSSVLIGSGLSSSASIEVLIGTIFNNLFNNGEIDPVVVAKTGQFAENQYFGKPCGLMDQVACSVGGIVGIDFENPAEPEIEKIDIRFSESGYGLIIINTGDSHADLTDDYASIPAEMKSVAEYFGEETCRSIPAGKFISEISKMRESVNDRAILRAYHFVNENERVVEQLTRLRNKDIEKFIELVRQSGDSSFKWLQNIYSPGNYQHQAVSLALAMSENFIREKGNGAARIHGGGFAGTIQAFIHNDHLDDYINYMGKVFGPGNVMKLSIRNEGAVQVF